MTSVQAYESAHSPAPQLTDSLLESSYHAEAEQLRAKPCPLLGPVVVQEAPDQTCQQLYKMAVAAIAILFEHKELPMAANTLGQVHDQVSAA